MKSSGMCLHIYSLPSSAFLTIKLPDFIVPEANHIPMLTFERVHFVKFHFHHSVFSQNTGLGTNILFINWSYIARSLVKIKSIGICLLPKWQGAHPSGESQGNLFFLQGQGKVREFCKMVREIRKSSKVREKSVNFTIMLG